MISFNAAARATRAAQVPATAPRQTGLNAFPSCAATAVALAVALLIASPQIARAANECGAEVAGPDTLTCSGASYPTGITYTTPTGGATFNLNNPVTVISGTTGVLISKLGVGGAAELIVNATSFGSITATSGPAIQIDDRTNVGLAAVTMDAGSVNSAASTASVLVGTVNAGNAQVTLNGGRVVNTGLGAGLMAQVTGGVAPGNASITITGGVVETAASAVRSFLNGPVSTGAASIRMTGGSVLAASGNGLWVEARGSGQARVEMTGGTAAASGTDSDGVFALSRLGTYAVDVTGATVAGGGGNGAAIHTSAAAGGTVNIGAGAVINAGASGVALRDGDANRDGVDEIGGNATIATAGILNGAIVLGGGTDSLTVTGGALNGNVTGDGADVLNLNLGSNNFVYGAPYAISGMSSVAMNSGTARLDGTVTGNTLAVNGGTLVLNNTGTFAGGAVVSGGTLAVNGTLVSSVNVGALGRLQGTGTVGSTTVAGTVAPGNSIGTLGVNGNFAQSSGSTYEVEIDPASSASDLVRVSGNANIAGGSRLLVVHSGGPAIGTRYTVLSADGGVIGGYNLSGDTQSAFARLVDSYDTNHVYLTAEKTRSISDAGGTPNEGATGSGLDSLPGSNGLANTVTWLPNDAAARDALNQLSADIHASSKTAALEDSRFVREAAIDRLRDAACAPGSTMSGAQKPGASHAGCKPEDNAGRAGWAQVFGSWGHIDSDGNASKLKRDIGGFIAGADTAVGAGWRVGALGGYSRASADTSARNSSSKTDSYHLGAYGGTQWGATALRLGLSNSWNQVATERAVAFSGFTGNLSGDYDSMTTQAFAEVGHRIELGRAALEPFAGLAHVRLHSDAFSEQGGPAALYGYGDNTDATFTTLGVRASTQAGDNIRLRGMLAWRHAFGDTTPTTTHAFGGGLPFTLAGVPLAKDVAALEAGVETQLRPNLTLSASYSGQIGGGLQDHGAKVELNWTF